MIAAFNRLFDQTKPAFAQERTFERARTLAMISLVGLGLVDDLGMIAKEDAIGRRLQDEALPHRKRALRRKPLELEIDA